MSERERVIIGFAGPMGSGKSTAAQYLVSQYEFKRMRFADPLKNMLLALPKVTREHTDGALKEEPSPIFLGNTPRTAMQTLGTEWGRGLAPDLWVNFWKLSLPDDDTDVVVDDVRFPNEVAAIREMGGDVIRIVRPGHEHSSSHSSEQEVDCDYMWANDGSIDALLDKIDDFFLIGGLGL